MNALRRKEKNSIYEALDEIIQRLETLKDDEEQAFDNMPESLQSSERGEKMTENIDKFGDIISELETQRDELEEID